MAIRISTSQTFRQGTNSILENQARVNQTQQQLSNGTRISQPSDDPIGSAVMMDLQKQIDNAKQYVANGQAAETRLKTQEGTLANTTDILQRIRDLALSASNSTMNQTDRETIALEMEQRLDELVGLGNTQLSSGDYLYSGFKTNVKPFTKDGSGSIAYNGDQGVRMVNVNASVQVESGNSGDEVFFDIKTGNGAFATSANSANMGSGVISSAVMSDPTSYIADTYTVTFQDDGSGNLEYQVSGANSGAVGGPVAFDEDSPVTVNGITYSISGSPAVGDSFTVEPSNKQDIFTTVQQVIAAIKIPNATSAGQASFQNAFNLGMQNLDQSLTHIDEVRASLGSRLNVIESERDINEGNIVDTESALSTVKDLDYAEAITELNQRTLALQAAQQSFVQVQNLSLFEYL
ncbi:flagellar hook-associated protein 3 [Ketobacter sp. MCCC 1A13808]|uniref:flagellar hook-associated protein FlgL n=1 Tax=Ketobacter sp. MCCC 1A13808 TaxID=2602738 RepID=UPI000F17740E|nr:flagellar hook-associated protein FlgL [Ketobacter sp. MCCC 1A13808]MVF12821.1 flagellar hook-associated protein 3 [Ketobacter sp. MCCC 1A13808]RLP54505.1 MAG: flagellar hook-associated protein 3 [Ketobacter sp.]